MRDAIPWKDCMTRFQFDLSLPMRFWTTRGRRCFCEHKRTQEKDIERVETYPLKIPPPGGEGESKMKPKGDGKATTRFPSACSS
jgi:hypothetical protein